MTLGIIVPLKSKQISRDWKITSAALEATISAICSQSNQDYVVVVVGHDCPDFLSSLDNKKITFKNVDFPAPNRQTPNFTNKELINDKNLKIITGLLALKSESLSYIYQLDSDDLIHSDFIKTVLAKDECAGMIINGGYIYYQSLGRIIPTKNVHHLCGSTNVISTKHLTFPPKADLEYVNDVPWTKYRHMNLFKFFNNDINKPFETIETPLLAYVVASGDNFSDRWRNSWLKQFKWYLRPYVLGKKVNKLFNKNFLSSSL
jgi:hypothetical protein